MKVGLIDVDGHNYPNLPLMKLSAYHQSIGDDVSFYDMFTGHCDVVYKAKVFGFTCDYGEPIDADTVIEGGTGYRIIDKDGKEFYMDEETVLPDEAEYIYPDYSLYPDLCKDTAYGFLTRGCPRNCGFCVVGKKEGLQTRVVADLNDFWNGQKYTEILDSNILSANYDDVIRLLEQLRDSKSKVFFHQGLDIRMMNEDYANILSDIKTDRLYLAWDNPKDKETPVKMEQFRKWYRKSTRGSIVYILSNYGSTVEEDLERIYKTRELGYDPYLMIYQKYKLPRGHELNAIQRWCNNKFVFRKCERFEDYTRAKR